ncbi:NADPH-dependent oxidoreductase [Candidatus Saccharibacteria bacterium CPR2]|nr:NADPH-dependent oxidoreductase [Candidatus Saccharibacteria bacterium CPR2]
MVLNIPILLGTTRPNNKSSLVARYVNSITTEIDGVETFIVDPKEFNFPLDGKDEQVKDPRYTKITAQADAFFVVTPEYNHSFPGTLKRMLDSELKNYIHKPVAVAGVSSGIFGGARVIEQLAPVFRELGLVYTFSDVHFPEVDKLFNKKGNFIGDEQLYRKLINTAFEELVWMAKVLKYGRESLENRYH